MKKIVLPALLMLALVFAVNIVRAQSADTLLDGLVGFWKFDSLDTGALTTPDSSGQNNFARVGTTTSLAGGRFGSAIKLDSNSAGQFISIEKPFGSNNWAVSSWVNPDLPIPTAAPYYGLVTILSGDTGTQLIGIQKDGVYMYTTKLASFDFGGNPGWHHVVVSYDGTNYTVAVDGTVFTPIAQPNVVSTNIKRHIGVKNPGATNNPFKGLIDETRLYSRALTASEISALYRNTTNIVTAPSAQVAAAAPAPVAASPATRPSTIIFKPENTSPKDLFANIQNEIDSRIGSLAANDATKNLWVQPRGNGTSSWKKSSTVWTGGIDWSGISPWNNDFNTNINGYYKAGTLVSPRHIIFANHFRIANGSNIIFIDRNGNMVTRKVAGFRTITGTDISVASLDSDVPETVTFYPVFKKKDLETYLKDGSTDTSLNLPFVLFDRDDHIVVRSTNKNRFFDPAVANINHDISPSGKRSEFNEDLVLGDSGNPAFVLVGGQPVLIFTNFDYKVSPSISHYFDQINAAMTSLGGGYQLSTIDLSGFTKPTISSNPTPSPTPVTPADGMLGYWKFDSVTNGNTPNSVTGGFTGAVTGAVSRAGKFLNSLYFDNTLAPQYVTISNPVALPQWTISAWVNPDLPIPTGVAPFHSFYTLLSGDTDILPILLRNDGVYVYDRMITPYRFSLNPGWHHVAVSYTGNTITATVDNVVTGSRTEAVNPLGLAVRKRVIGASSPFSTLAENQNKFGFKGYIDEVRLFNRVVQTSEFATIFGNNFPASPQTTMPTTPIATNLVLTVDKNQYALEETVKLGTTFNLVPEWASWIRNQNRTQGEATFTIRPTSGNALVVVPVAFNVSDTNHNITYDWNIPYNPALADQTYTVTVEIDDGRNNGILNTTKQFTTSPVTVTPAPASDSLNLENGLFGYWKFDSLSNNTTPDSSGNNNPGIAVGPTTLATGKFNQSLVFGDNNVVNGIDTTKGFGSPQWAMSLWIKPEVPVPTGAPFSSLLTFLSMDRDLVQNRARMLNIMKDGVYMYTAKIVDYNFNANPGWHHIVVNYDGKSITAVVDNNVKGSISFPNNPLADSRVQRRIGSQKEGTAHAFKGGIDEVRIYSRQLSLREIATLYDSNVVNIPTAGLTATKKYPPATLPSWTRYTNIQIDLSQAGWCKAATSPGIAYDAMPIKFNTSAGINLHYSVLSVKPGNSYTYYVQCIDKVGNKTAQEIPVTFSVQSDNSAPNIIEVSHSAVRDTTAEIVWSTVEKADSKVEYWERGTNARVTLTDQAFGYPHAMLLTGLKAGTTYDYVVSSSDSSGNRSVSSQKSFTTRSVAARTYYVSPEGNDANSGLDINNAFKTLERARDVIRTIRPLPVGGIQVLIKGGVYTRTTPFVLTALDSGTESAPIRYRALDANPVRINGGKLVTGFTANTNPRIKSSGVVQADLKSLGITDFGTRTNSGAFLRTVNSPLQLFFKDEPMILARYPNKINGAVSKINEWLSISSTDGKQTFSSTDQRPSTWASFGDIWVQGNWYFNHRHSTLAVQKIARNGSQYTVTAPGDATGMKVNRPFFYMNVPEEIDVPGEYYVDTNTGMLYFYPPGGINSGQAYVSLANDLLDMNGVKYTTFTGITFENARGKAIDMDRDTEFNMIENSIIRNVSVGAVIAGKQNGIWGSKIYNTEDNGVVLYGGKDKTLEGGYNYVVNSEIYNVATLNKSYRAAVNMSGTDVVITTLAAGPSRGVANRARYNHIHDNPHYGIVASGNNHLIDSNRIERVCEETIDCGAVYVYSAQPQIRGTIVKYNDISDVYGFDFENKYDLNAVGVYTDNAQSGITIFGNVLHNLDTGILQNLGRDNVVENNIITGTNEPLHLNSTGMNINAKQYPIQITEVSNTTPVIITTARPHNNIMVYEIRPDQTVTVRGALGSTGINGTWNFEIVDDYRLRLLGTNAGPGEYAGGAVLIQDTTIPDSMAAYNVENAPYSTFYPELTTMLDEPDYAEPLGTYYIRNAIYGNKVSDIENTRVGSGNKNGLFWFFNEKYIKFDPSNVTTVPFTVGNYAGLYSAGLSPVPTNQIGLIKGDTLPPIIITNPPVTPVTYTLTVTKSVGGNVTATDINCGADCQSDYAKDASVVLSATPDQGYTFAGWTGACTGATCTVLMNAAKTVSATFARTNTAPVAQNATFNVNGTIANIVLIANDPQNDALTFTPSTLTLPHGSLVKTAEGKYTYTLKAPVPTTAFTDTFTFVAKDVAGLSSAAATVDIKYTVTAPTTFTLTVTKAGKGQGTVTAQNLSCGQTCQAAYQKDSQVTLNISAASGSTFGGLTGGSCTGNACTVTLSSDKAVTATFNQTDSDADGIVDANDLCTGTPATLKTKIDKFGCPKPIITKFDIRPVIDSVALKNVVNATLGKTNVAQVKYNQPINLSRDNTELDIDSNLIITKNRVEVKSNNIPELNKPATITMYGVTEKNPKILRNGVECPPTQCVINSFKDGVLVFTVNGF